MERISLDGKVAFVTGAASGIGRATSVLLARAGAKVMLVDVNAAGLDETVRLIGDPSQCAPLRADMRIEAEVKDAVAKTISRFGKLDLAHNNAGIYGIGGPLVDYAPQMFEDVFRANVLSVFLCMQAQLPHMAERGRGVIVNTSSAAGLKAAANNPGYTTSKHAVVGLTRVAALEYSGKGVRVNALCPGLVRTPMTEVFGEEALERTKEKHPIGRIATAAEIAEAVLWLFSDRASFVTGAAMAIDGGYTIA